jgi:hypothetical protein
MKLRSGYITAAKARTDNGALSHESTGSARVNFFFKVLRDTSEEELEKLLECAHKENMDDTIKLVFQLRDVRGGKGERKQFLRCIRWYIKNGYEQEIINLLGFIPYYGRWKDVLELVNLQHEFPHVTDAIYQLYSHVLRQDKCRYKKGKSASNAGKWAPTEGGELDKKFGCASRLAKELGITLRQYRKDYLVPLRSHTNITEVWMCAQKWNEISYEKVAGICMHKNRKVFMKHDSEGYTKYLELVKKGDQKINASTVFPHTLIKSYIPKGWTYNTSSTLDHTTEAQWKELVRHCKENQNINLGKCLAVCDVSSSMYYAGSSENAMTVCVALGLLMAELAEEPFGNQVLNFHSDPHFCLIDGETLRDKIVQMKQMPWGGSTDLEKTFKHILGVCRQHNLPPENCPETIIIFSDMQFNQATRSNGVEITNYDNIKHMYEESGYQIPKIVFWNLNGKICEYPVKNGSQNTALVSGYSPSLFKLFLKGMDYSPYKIMRSAIDDERYNPINLSNIQPIDFSKVYYSKK